MPIKKVLEKKVSCNQSQIGNYLSLWSKFQVMFLLPLTSRISSHTMVNTQKYRTHSVHAGPSGGGGKKSTRSTYAKSRRNRKYITTLPKNDVIGANQNWRHLDTMKGRVGGLRGIPVRNHSVCGSVGNHTHNSSVFSMLCCANHYTFSELLPLKTTHL